LVKVEKCKKEIQRWWDDAGYLERIDEIVGAYKVRYGRARMEEELKKLPPGVSKLTWKQLPDDLKEIIVWYECKLGL